MSGTIRAYSCRPFGAEWHLVVFAATANRARLLAFRAGPSGEDDNYIDWRARRLPEADGLYASEAAWVHADDAPESVRKRVAGLWSDD
jgi:hypothetical protein